MCHRARTKNRVSLVLSTGKDLRRKANPRDMQLGNWGLIDLHDNVVEWCHEWAVSSGYPVEFPL